MRQLSDDAADWFEDIELFIKKPLSKDPLFLDKLSKHYHNKISFRYAEAILFYASKTRYFSKIPAVKEFILNPVLLSSIIERIASPAEKIYNQHIAGIYS